MQKITCLPRVPRWGFARQIVGCCDVHHKSALRNALVFSASESSENSGQGGKLVYEIEARHVIVHAVQHVRRMRGGSQAHLMRCSNGKFYVVKFRNNPQGVKVLANEFIVSNVARIFGLSVPCPAIVEVDPCLLSSSPELSVILPGAPTLLLPCEAGLQFGSEYAIDPRIGRILDWLPMELLPRVRNRSEFAGMLVLDKWMCNADNRQVAFWRRGVEKRYTASFIDHGYCFRCDEWAFRDDVLRGAFPRNEVYEHVTGWESFDPWLSRIESVDENMLWSAVACTPPQWYEHDLGALETLVQELVRRRGKIRELLENFRDSERRPFPYWGCKNRSWWVEPDQERTTEKRTCASA